MTRQTETATDVIGGGSAHSGGPADGLYLNPSTGPVGGAMTSRHEYSFSGVGPYYSVTTFLDIIHKQALVNWAKRTVAEFAVSCYLDGELGKHIGADGLQPTAEWLASLPDYERNTAASLGTAVHHLANLLGRDQKPLEGFGISERALPYVQAFAGFLEAYGADSIISSEKMVINFSEGYGGTYDLIMRINGELWLVDIKTSKGLYPETGLQLAAYQHAEFIILPNDPTLYPMPLIERCAVLHLRPDAYEKGWRLVEYQVRDYDYRAFLSARDLWLWRKEGRFQQKDLTIIPPAVPA